MVPDFRPLEPDLACSPQVQGTPEIRFKLTSGIAPEFSCGFNLHKKYLKCQFFLNANEHRSESEGQFGLAAKRQILISEDGGKTDKLTNPGQIGCFSGQFIVYCGIIEFHLKNELKRLPGIGESET